MWRTMLAWGIGAIVAAVGGCATSTTPDKTDSKSTESETSSSDSASQLETVSDQSSRNGREQARVADTIDRHVDKLESCYIRGALVAENPDLTGELTFGWTIDDQGRPHHVHLLDDQLGHQEIATCIQTILDGLTFTPPESDSLEVQYPFQFDRTSNIPHEDWYCRVHRSLETTWSPPENLDAERLRQLARQTVVYAQLTDEGAIRQVEFLRRPDQSAFIQSVTQLLESYRPEGDHRVPLPRGTKLRKYVQSTGLILQNWRDPAPYEKASKTSESTKAASANSSTTADSEPDKPKAIFDSCGDDDAAP